MAGENAAVKEGLPKREAAEHALTDPNDKCIKSVPITLKKYLYFLLVGPGIRKVIT
jgi:hypothetical protein